MSSIHSYAGSYSIIKNHPHRDACVDDTDIMNDLTCTCNGHFLYVLPRFTSIDVCRNALDGPVLRAHLETIDKPLAVKELWDREIVVPKEQWLSPKL